MKPVVTLVALLIGLVAVAATSGPATTLPVVDGKKAVAKVNGEAVTLDELTAQIAQIHASAVMTGGPVAKQDPAGVLDRMINSLLLVQEARGIGLDRLPEVRNLVDGFAEDTLRSLLFKHEVRDVPKPDAKAVEARYRDAVRTYELRSVLLPDEDSAAKFSAEVRGGVRFETAAAAWIASGRAEGGLGTTTAKAKELLPGVQQALQGMKPGNLSAPVPAQRKLAVFELVGVTYPDDPDARGAIEREAQDEQRTAAIVAYTDALVDRHVKIDRDLLTGLDFDASPDEVEKLREDGRTVATVAGSSPVTIAELTNVMAKKQFHGLDRAVEQKRLDRTKWKVLKGILEKRVILGEARRLGIENTDEYRRQVRQFEDAVLFGALVQKAIDPGLRVSKDEIRKYYADHLADYTAPEMVRLEAIAFARREDAEQAFARLHAGADLGWTRTNSEGRIEPASIPEITGLDKGLLVRSSLPPAVAKAIVGAAAGDFRFLALGDGAGPFVVLAVRDVVSPKPTPVEAVEKDIAGKLLAEQREKAIEAYADKLRAAGEIEVYAKGDALSRILGESLAGKM